MELNGANRLCYFNKKTDTIIYILIRIIQYIYYEF